MRKYVIMVLVVLGFLPALAYGQDNSWSQISQPPTVDKTWQSFVESTSFSLGETEVIGSLPDGTPLYTQSFGQFPRLDGSTVAVPLGMEIARQHLNLSLEDASTFIAFTTTHSAYVNLIERRPGATMSIYSQGIAMDEAQSVDLILATEPSAEELKMSQAMGVELVMEPVCLDAFIFITHKDNPVDSLTLEQIRGIYSGAITNWQEVGGNDMEIYAYQREANSGSQTAMETLVMQGEPMEDDRPHLRIDSMIGLVEAVGAYRNSERSLGYTYRYYLETLYPDDDIKTLSINGIKPSAETLRSAEYPFTTNYYAVYRAGEESMPAGQMADWLISDEGQRSIHQAGYITLHDVSRERGAQ